MTLVIVGVAFAIVGSLVLALSAHLDGRAREEHERRRRERERRWREFR